MQNYDRIKVLGAGAFGQAVLVRERGGERRHRVIKEVSVRPDKLAEAQHEAKVMGEVSHSNIVQYVDSFVEDRKFFIVMEYADGGDLQQAIERRRKARRAYDEREAMAVFVQCVLALRHVHARRILHRDIKCQNIFLTSAGVVKLGDFGVSKVLDGTAMLAQTTIGTPYYLSPEIFEDKPYGHKSDMWALGVVLYEVLTLRLPFEAKHMPGLMRKVLSSEPQAPPSTFSR